MKEMLLEKTNIFFYKSLIFLPLIILFSVTVFPFLFMFFISFFDVRAYNFDDIWNFVGFANYYKVISDEENIKSITNTILYIIYSLGIEITIGLGIAILLFEISRKYRLIVLSPFLLPLVIAPIVVGMIWKQIFLYEGGLLNKIISFLGFKPVVWLSHKSIFEAPALSSLQHYLNLSNGFISLIIMEAWQWTPVFICGFLVSFMLIKKEIIHSAIVDGASRFNVIKDIYVPMAKPLVLGLILLRIMDMLKVYETIWVLFGSSRNFANINIQLVNLGISIRNYSYCASFTVIIFIAVFLLLFMGNRLIDYAGKLYYE
jgi:multiple sugar transport system permease protein